MNLKELIENNHAIIGSLVLGTSILMSHIDFTFGEVCIVSCMFYFYIQLKTLIMENNEDE